MVEIGNLTLDDSESSIMTSNSIYYLIKNNNINNIKDSRNIDQSVEHNYMQFNNPLFSETDYQS